MLAGRGDIERYIEKVSRLRDKQTSLPAQVVADPEVPQKVMEEFKREIASLHAQSLDLFGAKSLYSKVLAHQITPEQKAILEAQRVARVERMQELNARTALAKFEIVVPLTQEQRESLLPVFQKLALSIEETDPLLGKKWSPLL